MAAAKKPQPKEAKEPQLVAMCRDPEAYPRGPHRADVHPEMVDDYAAAGWVKA